MTSLKHPKRSDVTQTLGVRPETKAEFKQFADERRRGLADIAAASIKALKRLPRDQQDSLIEGQPVGASQ